MFRLVHHISCTKKCCESDRSEWFVGFRREITAKPGQDSFHELITWKVNPLVASVTCTWYQIAFKWSVNYWLQLSIRWDGKYFKYFKISIKNIEHSSNSRKLRQQKFHNKLTCTFTAPCASKNVDWNQQQLMDSDILANPNSTNHPYCFLSNQKEVQILAFLQVICERIVSCPPPKNRLQR